jgi:PAS domain S-box-containing protein
VSETATPQTAGVRRAEGQSVVYPAGPAEAEATLTELASVFLQTSPPSSHFSGRFALGGTFDADTGWLSRDEQQPNVEARYRALVEQLPAVVFVANLERGIGEAYVSPQIEASLGFSQQEWLEDPVRWYRQIHADDKKRWSLEAAEMFLSGKPLRSAYRILARDGSVVWFQCEAKMIRREDGRPWFIHGAAFDITELKRAEASLQEERNVVTAILDTVGALVVVLDPEGRIVRFNRTCEQTTGYSSAEVKGKRVRDLFMIPEEFDRFLLAWNGLRSGELPRVYESHWVTRRGERRLIAWSTAVLRADDGALRHIIATGIDVTERKHLESAILEVSAREQRRIGQDLHDGLGQRLTGIAFMSKVLAEELAAESRPEAGDAAKIVNLVNGTIEETRELAHGLLPVVSEARGLMSALERWANEVEDLFKVSCWFQCSEPVLVHDEAVANHVYRIAQEAVNNAVKHGRARRITVRLGTENGAGCLTVQDDGSGLPEVPANHSGMGLHIMNYRVRMIGGSLDVRRCGERGGTLVACRFPLHHPELSGA